jgi:hypothetical protein
MPEPQRLHARTPAANTVYHDGEDALMTDILLLGRQLVSVMARQAARQSIRQAGMQAGRQGDRDAGRQAYISMKNRGTTVTCSSCCAIYEPVHSLLVLTQNRVGDGRNR